MNPELVTYIRTQTDAGVDKETIRKNLLTNGWNEVDINTAFTSTVSFSQQQPPVTLPQPLQPASRKRLPFSIIGLISILFLFGGVFYFSKPPSASEIPASNVAKGYTPSQVNNFNNGLFAKDASILLIVDSDFANALSQHLKTYSEDLKREYGYTTIVKEFTHDTPKETIRDQIKGAYQSNNLKGVLLMGDIQTAEYYNPAYTKGSALGDNGFPLQDIYYREVYDICNIKDNPLVKDEKNLPCETLIWQSPPFFRYPFWVSRLTPPYTVEKNGKNKNQWLSYLKNYFERNHNFRTGVTSYGQSTLFYLPSTQDDDKKNAVLAVESSPVYGRGKVDVISSSKAEFLEKIKSPFELLFVNAHGTPSWHQNDISSNEVKSSALVFEILSCSVGRFTAPDYMAGHYLFSRGGLFGSAASVPIYASLPPDYIFKKATLLGSGESISETYGIVGEGAMNLLGDPTLRVRYSVADTLLDTAALLDKKELIFKNVTEVNSDGVDRRESLGATVSISNISSGALEILQVSRDLPPFIYAKFDYNPTFVQSDISEFEFGTRDSYYQYFYEDFSIQPGGKIKLNFRINKDTKLNKGIVIIGLKSDEKVKIVKIPFRTE